MIDCIWSISYNPKRRTESELGTISEDEKNKGVVVTFKRQGSAVKTPTQAFYSACEE